VASALTLTLAPMTALQATVALGLFALATLAPQLGLSIERLGALNSVLFGIGALTAFNAGRLLRRFGGWPLATLCAAAVALGMTGLAIFGADAAGFAVLCFGLAFGPETPASAALLSAVTPASRRPLVFSVRQTGNQIGAIAGSLVLPALLLLHPRLPFASVALLACGVALWCAWRGRLQSRAVALAAPALTTASAWRLGCAPLRGLAAAAVLFSAMQMCLNVFLMSHAVSTWQLPVSHAGAWIALLQAGGLVGRLAWGALAQRCASASRLLGAIGLLAGSSGLALMLAPVVIEGAVFALLLALLGFSASGWNGVLVAEVSRIAGPARAGALSGSILGYGYLGLAVAPGTFAGLGGAVSTSAAFLALFGLASVAACALLLMRPAASAI
jgi:Major Facilitator Superfamily